MDDEVMAPAPTTGNAVLDGVVAATASAAVAAVTGNEEPQQGEEWTRVELFVIASLQLVLVLVAYRLDRQKHPALISESAWAMFFGVAVREPAMAAKEPREIVANVVMNWLDGCARSLASRCASFPQWCVRFS